MTELPRVALVEQDFPRPTLTSISEKMAQSFEDARGELPRLAGKEVAVAVGSRGLTNLAEIVEAALALLKKHGAEPFIVSAMGSHRGATDEGQTKILADYGITTERMSVPVRAHVNTVHVGQTPDNIPVFLDQTALEADGIVLINRVKPHTDFHGEVESGLLKMTVVGLGDIRGAETFHRSALTLPPDHLIQSIARVAFEAGNILFGIAILENAYHETADLELIPAVRILEREKELLFAARKLMPSLPVEQLDVLILDQIGKNISGAGMDPNITGRRFHVNRRWQEQPEITRIVVLGLTELSGGNATGIGLADFCSRRAVEQMDRAVTYLNSMTSQHTVASHIPLYFDSDRETIEHAASTSGSREPDDLRLIRIHDTLSLGRFEASQALIPQLQRHPRVTAISSLKDMSFDTKGRLS